MRSERHITRRRMLRLAGALGLGAGGTAVLAACGEPQVVEKIVTQTVEKIVEVPVERIVEKIVTVPVDRIVEKVVTVEVEKVVTVEV